ncbi:MAG: hypothetical protein GF418_01250 [Chitinivibrionales bacterium]|nr:hypothetical protein [Chitinivibrionales bacterium]MBD3394228.1 hypothetical protein [Chitinivibrionales bacterium]
MPDAIKPQGFELQAPPSIERVPQAFHAAYACACIRAPSPNFAPFRHSRQSRSLRESRATALRWIRAAALSVLGIAGLLVLGAAGTWGSGLLLERKIAPLRPRIDRLDRENARLDSLRQAVAVKSSLLGNESVTTYLLNGLQRVFPEGSWMDDISIVETPAGGYELTITALSYSTGLVPRVLDNLRGLEGAASVRMQYSEQTTEGKGRAAKKATRCRITAGWRWPGRSGSDAP